MKTILIFIGLVFSLLVTQANPTLEKYPNGNIKKSYSKDNQGFLTGEYKEFYSSGKIKISCMYEKNKINGFYNEYEENGNKSIERVYLAGKKNGLEKIFKNGELFSNFIFIQDELAFSRSIEEIKKTIKTIQETKIKFEGAWPDCYLKSSELNETVIKQNEECLRILMIYRYLCDVPYKNLFISREYIAKAMAANDIGKRNKFISHFPPNPGMPENEYKFACSGTGSCNLLYSVFEIPISSSVHCFMNDSDNMNREKVGHRRWCLSPQMQSTGFAANGGIQSMHSIDIKIKDLPETEFFAYPPKGFISTEYFNSDAVWSVSLNPNKYKKVNLNSVKISVIELDDNYLPISKNPYELEYSNVNSEYIAMDSSCIIFKPKDIVVAANKKYKVEIKGLLPKGKNLATIVYYVAFY